MHINCSQWLNVDLVGQYTVGKFIYVQPLKSQVITDLDFSLNRPEMVTIYKFPIQCETYISQCLTLINSESERPTTNLTQFMHTYS